LTNNQALGKIAALYEIESQDLLRGWAYAV